MCDYSLETVKTRPARVGDKVVTHRFWSATGGFCAPEDIHLAVCLLPGTEMSFAFEVKRSGLWPWSKNIIHHKTAIFRQVNLASLHAHHDALEFPDGEIVLLTHLMEGQEAFVLQLPVTGSKAPQRAAYVYQADAKPHGRTRSRIKAPPCLASPGRAPSTASLHRRGHGRSAAQGASSLRCQVRRQSRPENRWCVFAIG